MIKISEFVTRLNSLLQGILTSDLSDADRELAVRQATREYSGDLPRVEVVEFPGAASSYYLLQGKAIDVDEAGRDAGIDLTSSGADSKLGVLFTLSRAMEVQAVRLWLSRTGAPEGMLTVKLYTTSANLPVHLIATSEDVDIDGVAGAPLGRYAPVRFDFPAGEVFELPAGTYCAVLEATGYTYVNGTTEVILGVDQSDVINSVTTFDGTSWSAYGTDSAGIIEVFASTPGWRDEGCALREVEYPAATLSSNEEPQLLNHEEFGIFRTAQGSWLRLEGYSPAASETVRLTFSREYQWLEAADAEIDIPAGHFEAVCNLAAAVSCEWLATRYGQKRESSINADSVERRTQADVYLSLAKRFRSNYELLAGLELDDGGPGMALVDVDVGPELGRDFLFHRRSSR